MSVQNHFFCAAPRTHSASMVCTLYVVIYFSWAATINGGCPSISYCDSWFLGLVLWCSALAFPLKREIVSRYFAILGAGGSMSHSRSH